MTTLRRLIQPLRALTFPPLPYCPRCASWHVNAPCGPAR